MKVVYQGIEALVGAQHCQFVARAGDIAPLVRWDNFGSADESKLDERINNAMLLRLNTVDRNTRHMGNVLDNSLRNEIADMGFGYVVGIDGQFTNLDQHYFETGTA